MLGATPLALYGSTVRPTSFDAKASGHLELVVGHRSERPVRARRRARHNNVLVYGLCILYFECECRILLCSRIYWNFVCFVNILVLVDVLSYILKVDAFGI